MALRKILLAGGLMMAAGSVPAAGLDVTGTLTNYLKSPIIAPFDNNPIPATAACPASWTYVPVQAVPLPMESFWMRSIGTITWTVRQYRVGNSTCAIIDTPERRALSADELTLLLRADAAMTRQEQSGTAISPWISPSANGEDAPEDSPGSKRATENESPPSDENAPDWSAQAVDRDSKDVSVDLSGGTPILTYTGGPKVNTACSAPPTGPTTVTTTPSAELYVAKVYAAKCNAFNSSNYQGSAFIVDRSFALTAGHVQVEVQNFINTGTGFSPKLGCLIPNLTHASGQSARYPKGKFGIPETFRNQAYAPSQVPTQIMQNVQHDFGGLAFSALDPADVAPFPRLEFNRTATVGTPGLPIPTQLMMRGYPIPNPAQGTTGDQQKSTSGGMTCWFDQRMGVTSTNRVALAMVGGALQGMSGGPVLRTDTNKVIGVVAAAATESAQAVPAGSALVYGLAPFFGVNEGVLISAWQSTATQHAKPYIARPVNASNNGTAFGLEFLASSINSSSETGAAKRADTLPLVWRSDRLGAISTLSAFTHHDFPTGWHAVTLESGTPGTTDYSEHTVEFGVQGPGVVFGPVGSMLGNQAWLTWDTDTTGVVASDAIPSRIVAMPSGQEIWSSGFLRDQSTPLQTSIPQRTEYLKFYTKWWGPGTDELWSGTTAIPPPSGSLSASQTLVVVNPGQNGSTTLNWKVQNLDRGRLMVSVNGAAETLISENTNNATLVNWLTAGSNYDFVLRDLDANELARVRVTCVSKSGAVTPDPAVVTIPYGQNSGSTVVSWSTAYVNQATLWVQRDSGPEEQFASGLSGSQTAANWLVQGTFTFRLREGTQPTGLVLGQAAVSVYQVTDPNSDAFEVDDTRDMAKPIAHTDAPQTHKLHVASDVDWVMVWLPGNKRATFTLTGSGSSAAWTANLWGVNPANGSLNLEDTRTFGSAAQTVGANPLGDGRMLWVEVKKNPSVPHSTAPYTVGLTFQDALAPDAYEPNDTRESATTGAPATQIHTFHFAGDEDWIAMWVGAGLRARVQVTPTSTTLSSGWSAELYTVDTSTSSLVFDQKAEVGAPGVTFNLDGRGGRSGWLRMRRSAAAGSSLIGPASEYRVVISTISEPAFSQDPYEPDNTRDTFRALDGNQGSQYYNFHAANDEDWAGAWIPQNVTLNIDVKANNSLGADNWVLEVYSVNLTDYSLQFVGSYDFGPTMRRVQVPGLAGRMGWTRVRSKYPGLTGPQTTYSIQYSTQ